MHNTLGTIDTGTASLVTGQTEDRIYKSVWVSIEEKDTKLHIQDIVTVESALDGEFNRIPDTVCVYVYADTEDEGFTHKFTI